MAARSSTGRGIACRIRLAWIDVSRGVAVCYPWPANWLARQWREAVWRVNRAARALQGPSREQQEIVNAHRVFRERQVLAEHYASGYLTGWQECYDACLEALEEELMRAGISLGRREVEPRRTQGVATGKRSKPN